MQAATIERERTDHVLTAGQFDPVELFDLFERAEWMREAVAEEASARQLATRHLGKIVTTMFYEPSTRTRLSFESAALRQGAAIISTENAAEFSSAAKGESIEDSTRVLDGYGHVIIMRHKETGAAERAASVSRVPVINAGDGTGEHPTQALLDVYTIFKEKGRLDNLKVVIGGDLKRGRTARSLARMLAKFPGNEISFVSTPELGMGEDVLTELDEHNIKHTETSNVFDVVGDADVVYWTRMQLERAGKQQERLWDRVRRIASVILKRLLPPTDKEAPTDSFVINQTVLDAMPPDAIVMHPLPRVGEITKEVDDDPRAAYFRQAENGLYMRMALLDKLLSRS